MLTLEGLAVSPGFAKGPIHILQVADVSPAMRKTDDPTVEIARAKDAISRTAQQLRQLHERAAESAGGEAAAIFEIHGLMLEDEDFLDAIFQGIEVEQLCAEYSIYRAGKQFFDLFACMDDDLMKERAADVHDLARRLLNTLTGNDTSLPKIAQPVVVAAEELLPSQTIALDKALVVAFLSRKGAMNSHAAILARSLGIPAIVNLGEAFSSLKNGDVALVDGNKGSVVLQPAEDCLAAFEAQQQLCAQENRRLEALVDRPAETSDGFTIELCANIGRPDELSAVMAANAEGIGLFRSEFLYLDANELPTEELQFIAYKTALQAMAPRRVVVRTLDLGADKNAPCFQLETEGNPALGYRGIRICLDRPDIFAPQLRALLRASVYGRLGIMFPMITGPEELGLAYQALEQVKEDLAAEGVPFSKDIEYGIMVETPAAVLMADQLAPRVDFFSIGTNDLTQYTMAADRMNSRVSHLFQPGATALLRAVYQVVLQARQAGIWVGICGESAADLSLVPYYIGMGVDELSMASHSIPKVKDAIRKLNKSDCKVALWERLELPKSF